MSAPIPISPKNSPPTGPNITPSSSISISPQTPFFPPPGFNGLTSPTSSNPPGGNGTGAGFLKWAASFSGSLSRSPPSVSAAAHHPQPVSDVSQHPPAATQTGFAIPSVDHGGSGDEHDHDEHDSFEFGDFGRTWAQGKVRRAVSMSAGPGSLSGMGLGSAITGGSGGSGAVSGGGAEHQASMPVGSLGNQGVMGEKAARGQGVLRRLSLSGTSFARPSFLSPPLSTAPTLPSPPTSTVPLPKPVETPAPVMPQIVDSPPKTGAGVTPASAIPGGPRGRRFSENGGNKKRGVSPMGERILRDHSHF